MGKWADYLISEVKYSPDHRRILQAKVHKDDGETVGQAEIVDRDTISSNLKKGITYMTIHNGSTDKWKIGEKVRTFMVENEYFIRADKNKVSLDNLGLLNEF